MQELIKFEKSLILNDDEYENILHCTLLLYDCMKRTNDHNKMRTEFLSMRLKYPDDRPFGKELILEWACTKINAD